MHGKRHPPQTGRQTAGDRPGAAAGGDGRPGEVDEGHDDDGETGGGERRGHVSAATSMRSSGSTAGPFSTSPSVAKREP